MTENKSEKLLVQVAGHGGIIHSPIAPQAVAKQTDIAEVLMYLIVCDDGLYASADVEGEESLGRFIPKPFAASWTIDNVSAALHFHDRSAVRSAKAALLPIVEKRMAEGLENLNLASEECCIHIQNEIWDMLAPCIMDVKLGRLRHTPRTPLSKVAKIEVKEGGKYVSSGGVRICGFVKTAAVEIEHSSPGVAERVFGDCSVDEAFAVVERRDRDEFRDLDEKGFVDTLRAFCNNDKRIIADLADEVNRFERSLSRVAGPLLESFGFVSSSLLLIYDAAGFSTTSSLPLGKGQGGCHVKVRWIDFARSGPRRFHFEEDAIGFLQGVRTLASSFSQAASC